MRVLHVHSGNMYGGIETMLGAIMRHPASAEHAIALCFEGRLRQELAATGRRVEVLGDVRLSRPLTVWRARRRLAALLARLDPDVVITHSSWSQAAFGPTLSRARGRGIEWIHGPLEGRLDRLAARHLPSHLLCNSEFTRSQLPPPYSAVPSSVLYCPVPLPPKFSPPDRAAVRAQLRTSDADVAIVQASRLEAWKGHEFLLRAAAALPTELPWIVWIAGGAQRPEEQRYLAQLERLVAGLGIAERVRFAGQSSNVPRLFAAADIYCQANAEPEPFGVVYVEALAAGLPVVAFDAGGVREIVDASTGVLAPSGDVSALAAELGRLVADAAVRRRLGAAGPARAAALCDPEIQVPRLNTWLRSVMESAA